jgi:hypothetical protein
MHAASSEPFVFVSKTQAGWDNDWIPGMGVRMFGNDAQCIMDPDSPIEHPQCLFISTQAQLQQVLASKTPLRTLTCGSEHANTYHGIFLMASTNRSMDPGGYYSLNWCVAVKTVLKNTGGLRSSILTVVGTLTLTVPVVRMQLQTCADRCLRCQIECQCISAAAAAHAIISVSLFSQWI